MSRKHTGKKEKKSIRQRIKLIAQLVTLGVLIVIAVSIFFFYRAYGRQILQLQADAKLKARASTEDTFKASQTGLVYDADGNLISTLKSEKDVYYLNYEEIPEIAIKAMVVTEDRKFLEHDGVDYLANIRAAIALIKHKGKITQGASTITQQLSRNVFLTQNVTYERKIEEIFIAQELEKKYTKAQIMEFYINDMYCANGHYGLQAAARGYFGKGVSGLSMSQIVFLCAIPNSPNRYNPLINMENTLERRDRILKQLLDEGMISSEQYTEAVNEKIKLHQNKTKKRDYVETYTYYCAIRALMKEAGFTFRNQFESEEDRKEYENAYEELYDRYQKELYVSGYRIYTSIELDKQKLLQKSVDKTLKEFKKVNEEGVYQMQGAAVCIDNDSGRVVAIVGGRDQKLEGYTLNRAYQSYRQPGSSIKPLIVYTPSFEREYTPDNIVVDEKIKDGPRNAGGGYSGKIKLQRAIELSKNTIAWKLLEELSPRVGLSYLLNMNFVKIKDSDYTLAAALGGLTVGVSPVEMAAAYATLENDGYYRTPTCIVKIMDSEGNEIVGDTMETKQVYQTRAARIMTEEMMGVIKNGTGRGLGLSHTVSAGKTGTTNDKKDGWFVGYTPYYTTSVWVGLDIPQSVSGLQGASYPGAIWHNFMEEIHTKSMNREFELYDWRADLKAEKEAKENAKEKALDEAQKKDEKETPDQNTLPQEDPTDGEPVNDGETVDRENNIEDGDTDMTEDGTEAEGDMESEDTAESEEPMEDEDTAEEEDDTDAGNTETTETVEEGTAAGATGAKEGTVAGTESIPSVKPSEGISDTSGE
jgi:membrane peptidoglycan carboxypeptidase